MFLKRPEHLLRTEVYIGVSPNEACFSRLIARLGDYFCKRRICAGFGGWVNVTSLQVLHFLVAGYKVVASCFLEVQANQEAILDQSLLCPIGDFLIGKYSSKLE